MKTETKSYLFLLKSALVVLFLWTFLCTIAFPDELRTDFGQAKSLSAFLGFVLPVLEWPHTALSFAPLIPSIVCSEEYNCGNEVESSIERESHPKEHEIDISYYLISYN